jgi:hypothetical protein
VGEGGAYKVLGWHQRPPGLVEFVATKYRGGEIRWAGTVEVALRLDCSGIVWSLNNHGLSDRLILNRNLVSGVVFGLEPDSQNHMTMPAVRVI